VNSAQLRKVRAYIYQGVRAGRISPENAEVLVTAAEQHAAGQTEPPGLAPHRDELERRTAD
jgi:hypothetical protein